MTLATIVLAAAAAATIEHAGVSAPSQALRDEIYRQIDESAAAWSRGDIDAFCAGYAENALFVTPTGPTLGRRTVLERYKAKYPDAAAMGTLKLQVVDMREAPRTDPAATTAVTVVARWTLSYPDKPEASGWTLIVLHRIGSRWLIVQDASM